MDLPEEKILDFWRWFVKNDNLIKNCIENSSQSDQAYVVEQMNNYTLSFGTFTWDIGLDDSNAWFFTISPNGDEELLKVSEEIMAMAPVHMDWIFHSSKPAKVWDRRFNVYNDLLDSVDIDASSWHYIAFEEDDGRLELIIEAQNLDNLDAETAEIAANLFVVSELGEKVRIDRVSTVSIVRNLESEYEDSKAHISDLKEHVNDQ